MQVAASRPRERQTLSDYLDPILHDCCGSASHIVVALSGGPDSMALTLLMRDWCKTHGVELTTLTVDHQLRVESADEAKQVGAWMHAQRIDHRILTPIADDTIRNIQSRARAMRYDVLTQWCRNHGATHLLLAQHYDDQAETVALQQHRGESPPSRAGMALCRTQDGITLTRPLLGIRKVALVNYLQEHGQPFIDDPSNASDVYARNRLRGRLTDADELWRSAQRMGRQRHADELQRNAWFMHHAINSLDLVAWRTLAPSQRTDYLSHAIRVSGGKTHRPRHYETEHLASRLVAEDAGKATLGRCLIAWKKEAIRITPEHPLEPAASAAYMAASPPPNPLVSEPFWWFNYAPYNDGAETCPR